MTAGAAFKDHFSDKSANYARYRPRYPDELFRHLAGLCERHELAWDCATGNGQSALGLADHFAHVVATDASAAQIAAAAANPGVTYRVAPAEQSGLDDNSVDLLTVGQALHWFHLPQFFAEAKRVVKRAGVVATWSYRLCSVDEAVDAVIDHLYSEIVDSFWPPERDIVDNAYRDIEFPAQLLTVPDFEMALEWNIDDMLGYLRTWSASKRYAKHHGQDPVNIIEARLRETWGERKRNAIWPLTVCAYRVAD